jgi:TolB-like protein/Tfp pilus assembly protein PilF
MISEHPSEVKFEIGHVLFLDIVGYSKLLITEQSERLQTLKEIVRGTEQFRLTEAEGKLLRLPTGDGVALVFRTNPEAPVLCALEISKALKNHPELQVRMGVHSGPVNEITDLNEQANIAGAGINIAQRVMDCGDAGHILLSKRVADDLEHYPRWRPYLRELGECSVKHGMRLFVVNLHTGELGNPQQPKKFTDEQRTQSASMKRTRPLFVGVLAVLSLIALAIVGMIFTPAILRSREKAQTRNSTPADQISNITIPEKSIAVLPFANLSDDKANAYFTDGIQDEILTKLSHIADLKVISRTSTSKYKSKPEDLRTVAQQLGVAHILEGSVQRAADKVHINVQLIDARADAHLWAESYDRELKDVFAVESEVSQKIANSLQAKLSPAEKNAIERPPTTDLGAFDLYSRAKSLLLTAGFSLTNDPDARKAIELLDEAVKRDPSFFDAYCQLARAHEILYAAVGFDHTPARLALAEAALQAATRLRPDAGETHLARANYLYYGTRDYDGALAELKGARRTLPNDPRLFELTGYILRRRGQQEEGLRDLKRAVELDPRNLFTLQQIALSYQFLGRNVEAIATLDRALSIVPDNVETRANRAQYELLWKGDTRPLHQTIDSIVAQGPDDIASAADTWFACALAERDSAAVERALVAVGDNPCWVEGAIRLSRGFGEGLLARMTKNEAKARAAFAAARAQQEKIVQAQSDYGPPLCVLAMIDAALGHKELALEEGGRAIALTPLEKDVISGSRVLQYFAITAAWAGEKELALQQLETGLRAPTASQMLSYGALKLLPFWDPLRGDPRFEQIVASAPKE